MATEAILWSRRKMMRALTGGEDSHLNGGKWSNPNSTLYVELGFMDGLVTHG